MRQRQKVHVPMAIGGIVVATALGLSACGQTAQSVDGAVPSPVASAQNQSSEYVPGTASTATSQPKPPVISSMSFAPEQAGKTLVVPVVTSPGSDQDKVVATLKVHAPDNEKAVIQEASTAIAPGVQEARFTLTPKTVKALKKASPQQAKSLIKVTVRHEVDGDANGDAEGYLHTTKSFASSQGSTAGETLVMTYFNLMPNDINVVTNPVMCMESDGIAELNGTIPARKYVTATIEADAGIFDDPTYDGQTWEMIGKILLKDVAKETIKYFLDLFDPWKAPLDLVNDVIGLATHDCDAQASPLFVVATSPDGSSSTGQGYVVTSQVSQGMLGASNALNWQKQNERFHGGVWQTTVSDPILASIGGAGYDKGMSINAQPQPQSGTHTAGWIMNFQPGGSSTIPDPCHGLKCS